MGDGPKGEKRSSADSNTPPSGTDVDFIQVNGTWKKIRGPVWINDKGEVLDGIVI